MIDSLVIELLFELVLKVIIQFFCISLKIEFILLLLYTKRFFLIVKSKSMSTVTSFASNFASGISYLGSSMGKPKNVILDPLTTLVRLAALSYMEEGTKIGIHKNQIFYYPPYYFQWLFRSASGDKRDDLTNLYKPIKKSVQWYGQIKSPEIKYIFSMAHKGLLKLIEMYKEEGIKNQTELILENFDNILTGKHAKIYDSVSPEEAEAIKKELEDENDNVIHKTLRGLWGEVDISIVYGLLQKMEASGTEDAISTTGCLDSMEQFLRAKDVQVEKIVNKHSQSL